MRERRDGRKHAALWSHPAGQDQERGPETLNAYKIVAHDLLKTGDADDGQLRAALGDLEKALATKS